MEDQVQVTAESTEETSEELSQEPKQSNETAQEPEQKLYKDRLGNEYTADQLYEQYSKVTSEFDKVAQERAQLRKEREQWKATSEDEARTAVTESEDLKDVPQEVKEAVIKIVQPLFEQYEQQKEEKAREQQTQAQFKKELDDLEKKYDGKNGLPKFDRNKVLLAMKDPNNRIYDPEAKHLEMNREAYNDYLIKQALKGKSGGLKTETTTGDHSQPESKTPTTWADSRRAALSRFTSTD